MGSSNNSNKTSLGSLTLHAGVISTASQNQSCQTMFDTRAYQDSLQFLIKPFYGLTSIPRAAGGNNSIQISCNLEIGCGNSNALLQFYQLFITMQFVSTMFTNQFTVILRYRSNTHYYLVCKCKMSEEKEIVKKPLFCCCCFERRD